MFNKKIFILAALLLGACSHDGFDKAEMMPEKQHAKIVNTSETAVNNTLVVHFNEEVIEQVEKAALEAQRTRSALTRSGLVDVDAILQQIDLVSMERVFPEAGVYEERTRRAGLHCWYTLQLAEGEDIVRVANLLAEVADIKTIQYTRELTKASSEKAQPMIASRVAGDFTPLNFNDPHLKWQWHYINNADLAISQDAKMGADINVAEAWKLTAGDPRIVVAVVDEGVKYTHPDLAANMWVNPNPDPEMKDLHGYNFIERGPISWGKPMDTGHGTHVAGTVAAVNNNGVGVSGVAGGTGKNDGVRIMSCQIFSGENRSSDVQSSQAIKYAADHGASVLQCSYGYSNGRVRNDEQYQKEAPLEYAALNYFMQQSNCDALEGGLVIFAAGNESRGYASYPGAFTPCVCVSAFGCNYLPGSYSNYGPGCNISAPGGEMTNPDDRGGVLSTLCSETSAGADYGYMQGTRWLAPMFRVWQPWA